MIDKLNAHHDALRVLRDTVERDGGPLHPAVDLLTRAMRAIDDAIETIDNEPLEV